MQDLFQRALEYKLALLVAVFFTVNSLATSITAAFLHTDWSTLSRTEKFVLLWVIAGSFSNTMLAFVNKTLSRVERKLTPIDTELLDQKKEP